MKKEIPKIRSAYDGSRVRVVVDCSGDEVLVEQHHKNDCDINNIIRKYDTQGIILHVNKAVAQYGDFTEINEYQESLNTVIKAEEAFTQIPSDIRKKFGNDAGAFFEFATDPKNVDKMIEYGLANKIEAPKETIQKVTIVEPLQEKPAG